MMADDDGLNSTMVRLKLKQIMSGQVELKGLNSTMVRLKRIITPQVAPGIAVSIPLWFD